MIDTHCHLNFKAFMNGVNEVIDTAKRAGVTKFVVPGTDISTSELAVELAGQYPCVHAAVGIHPHHIYQYHHAKGKEADYGSLLDKDLAFISKMVDDRRVVAVGEVGMDRYYYRDTKYSTYQIDPGFIDLQVSALARQIRLAVEYRKALILHNRLAAADLLEVLGKEWEPELEGRTVFHCAEPEERLLEFARKNKVFIGVDGDLTWSKRKQRFIREVPLSMLVLETDAPFLTPEPVRFEKQFPNEPKNITLVREFVSKLKETDVNLIEKTTTENAQRLFGI